MPTVDNFKDNTDQHDYFQCAFLLFNATYAAIFLHILAAHLQSVILNLDRRMLWCC